jgi:hypothetical protein
MSKGESSSVKKVGRVFAAIGVVCLGAGCGTSVTASSGAVFKPSEAKPDALRSALAASAARDLPCASSNLDVRRDERELTYVVRGCGSQVTYRVMTPTVASKRIELVSRRQLTAENDHSARQ